MEAAGLGIGHPLFLRVVALEVVGVITMTCPALLVRSVRAIPVAPVRITPAAAVAAVVQAGQVVMLSFQVVEQVGSV